MTLSLHEQRILTEIDRDLSRDAKLRTLATYLSPPPQTWTRQSEPGTSAAQGYLITGDGRAAPRHSRRRRVLTVLATVVFLVGPLMLVPAILTGISVLAVPVLVTPVVGIAMLAIARRKGAAP